jgi:uncharacterized integral membrane protein (TIGR00697 family)
MTIDNRLKLFLVLMGGFITALIVGDIVGGKLTEATVLGQTFTISIGMIPFPITFLLTDLLNEFYGKRAAGLVTWIGFGCAVFAFTIITVSVGVPFAAFTFAPDYTGVNKAAFDNVLAGSQRILIASMFAYLAAQFTDIAVFQFIKRVTRNRFLWLRATGSTVVSQLIDTVVIQTIAWYGVLPVSKIANIAVSSYIVKVVVAVALTPLIYGGHTLVERFLRIAPVRLDAAGEQEPEPLSATPGEGPA